MLVTITSIFCTCNGQSKVAKQSVTNDAMAEYFGDTVASIFAAPTKVQAYILSMDEPTEKSQTMGGFAIKKRLGNVKEAHYSILQFLMQDESNYLSDSAEVRKCFFKPYLAFEFVKGKETVSVLIAFNCECWGVVFNNKVIEKPYICQRQLLRFVYGFLPKDEYINELLKYQKEDTK